MNWLNEYSRAFLNSGYLTEGETAEKRIRDIADKFGEYIGSTSYADKFYNYMEQGFYSLASPVWANYGRSRGLSISCFGSQTIDSVESILETLSEVGMMSKHGGGTSGYFGNLRPRGTKIGDIGESSGAVHFMGLFDKMIDTISQGGVRRGQFAAYLDADHGDIDEFLEIGCEGSDIQKIKHGVVISDDFMEQMIAGDEKRRKIWAKIIQKRVEVGYPYIFFKGNANKYKPECYCDREILASNLCSEIMLPYNKEESFVCCLSSMNLLHYDKWKDTDAVEILTMFLDSVMQEFIEKARGIKYIERAVRFAERHRALGVGALGWHSLLQSKMIPFESKEAAKLNLEIFELLQKKTSNASVALGLKFGTPELLSNRRNTTTMAIAPTMSSSFILGQVSSGIEPIWSNCYVKDLQKAKVTIKNPFLEILLESKGENTREVWQSIKENDGSVQHLDFLSEKQKNVFKTFSEINQRDVISQAAVRQKFIDQGQSLNIMIHPDTPAKEINKLYIEAWRMGIKSLYYQHSLNAAQQLSQKNTCTSCQA